MAANSDGDLIVASKNDKRVIGFIVIAFMVAALLLAGINVRTKKNAAVIQKNTLAQITPSIVVITATPIPTISTFVAPTGTADTTSSGLFVTPAPSVTPKPTGKLAKDVCSPSSLKGDVAFQGSVILFTGLFTITNTGKTVCSMNISDFIGFVYDQAKAPALRLEKNGMDNLGTYSIQPGGKFYTTMRWKTQQTCTVGYHDVPFTFVYEYAPGTRVVFTDNKNNPNVTLQVCNSESFSALVTLNSWSDKITY